MALQAVLVVRPDVVVHLAEEQVPLPDDAARPRQRHVLDLVGDDQVRAAPLLVRVTAVLRKDVVAVIVRPVQAGLQHGPLTDVKLDMALEPDRAGKKRPLRQHDPSSAGARGGVHGTLDGDGVLRLAIALRAKVVHIEVGVGRECRRRAQDRRKEKPSSHRNLHRYSSPARQNTRMPRRLVALAGFEKSRVSEAVLPNP